jgi:hypothetical protein
MCGSTTDLDISFNYQLTKSQEFPFLFNFYILLSRYLWIVPVTIGVPGNVVSILVANRKHNRALSPCIYMKAMAVADSLVLLEHGFALPIMYWEIGQTIVDMRDVFFK